jgi:hypothetical protein
MVSIHSKISRANGWCCCPLVQHSVKLCAISAGKIFLRTILVWNGIFFFMQLLFFRQGVFYAAAAHSARGLARQAPILPQLGCVGQQN